MIDISIFVVIYIDIPCSYIISFISLVDLSKNIFVGITRHLIEIISFNSLEVNLIN